MKYNFNFGTSDFKKLIENKNFFVDKSLFIKEVINESSDVLLIPRPRRFGKSLNFSMLRYFFDIKEESRELFEGLKISEEKECLEHMNKYPVLSIDFKGIGSKNWEETKIEVIGRISDIYVEYREELWEVLEEKEKEVYEDIEKERGNNYHIKTSIEKIIKYIERRHKEKVVVLIDEYDAVITSMYGKEGFEECMEIFRGLYGNALKGNNAIHKALMTGIMRVAKEGIFSGLNNVIVYGVTDSEFGSRFGFLEEEIKDVIIESNLNYEEVKNYYNGYNFGGNLVYNPWSVANCLKRGKYGSYWKNTSGNDLVKELVKKGGPEVKYSFERMLEGESVNLEVEDNVNLRELQVGDIYSLLLQSGYLTYEEGDGVRKYKLPNKEVRDFISSLEDKLNKEIKIPEGIEELLVERDWEKLEKALELGIIRTMSYFDLPKNEGTESSYHMMLSGLFSSFKLYRAKSNVESGLGRLDILLSRKDKREHIIIEIKAGNSYNKLEELLEKAKRQIKEKRYGDDLEGEVIKIGIGFIGKEVKLGVVE